MDDEVVKRSFLLSMSPLVIARQLKKLRAMARTSPLHGSIRREHLRQALQEFKKSPLLHTLRRYVQKVKEILV